MKAPRLRGRVLAAVRMAAETRGTDAAVREIMRSNLGITDLAKLPKSFRGDLPQHIHAVQARARRELAHAGLGAPSGGDWPRRTSHYAEAYAAGRATPHRVAEVALGALEELSRRRPTMNLLVSSSPDRTRADARASTARHQAKEPRGPLDGVPFLVKDEYDVAGLPTTLGSPCEPTTPATEDSTVVGRLADAGAVFMGKTVLTEYGMSPIGGNVHAEMPHNAHDPTRAPGGSSTGSAVGVALGVGPIATAGDGGGSIRIPAALNGIFGIKPTFGRVSRAGDGFWGSVAHCGPVGSSTEDLALFLDAVASTHDSRDPLTEVAPAPPAGGFGARLGAGVQGLRIGVDAREWQDAEPDVVRAGQAALRALEGEGAVLVDIDMQIAHHAAKIGYMTIGPESLCYHLAEWNEQRAKMGDDLRVSFAALSGMSCADYLDAQRLRSGLRKELAEVLTDVDVLGLPTTAITAPEYGAADEGVSFSDPVALDGLCRFAFLGNLTGLPAATAPVGVGETGLPVGLQILGDAWAEDLVLGVLAHLERMEIARCLRPAGAFDLLSLAT